MIKHLQVIYHFQNSFTIRLITHSSPTHILNKFLMAFTGP